MEIPGLCWRRCGLSACGVSGYAPLTRPTGFALANAQTILLALRHQKIV